MPSVSKASFFFIKKLLRKHNQCLAQIVRCSELDELSNGVIKKRELILTEDCEYIHKKGPICEWVPSLIGGKQYKRYRNNCITLSCDDDRNNCAVLDNGIYIPCLNFVKKNEKIYVVGRKFIYGEDIFSEPRSSMDVGSYLASESEEIDFWKSDLIIRKLCVINYDDKFAVIPLLHLN